MGMIAGREALDCLSGDTYEGETSVVCPNCRFDYTHIAQVGTLVGSDKTEALAYKGAAISGATPERRSAVEIVFRCETCNNRFAIVIQQRKGVCLVQIKKKVVKKCKTTNPQKT